jgi:hypothetical protein
MKDDRRSGQWPLLTSPPRPGWVVIDVDGELSLFGFAARHPRTCSLSWMLSTEIIELDESAGPEGHPQTADRVTFWPRVTVDAAANGPR